MNMRKRSEILAVSDFSWWYWPDGHIAFNVRGSDHNSTTRLMATNFETQAAAATDLGGIEVSGNRLVITIGLGTITYNKNATAIIIAAGEAKAPIVKKSLESMEDVKYPATCLQALENSRFYIQLVQQKCYMIWIIDIGRLVNGPWLNSREHY